METRMKITKQKLAIYIGMLILTTILGFVFYIMNYDMLQIILYYVLAYSSIWIAYIDHKEKIIPNKILLPLLGVRTAILLLQIILNTSMALDLLLSALLGFAIGGLLLLFFRVLARGGVGMGDVKFFAIIGYYVGSGSIFGFLFMAVFASFIESVFLLLTKKITLKGEIPMAPAISVGIIISLLLGI